MAPHKTRPTPNTWASRRWRALAAGIVVLPLFALASGDVLLSAVLPSAVPAAADGAGVEIPDPPPLCPEGTGDYVGRKCLFDHEGFRLVVSPGYTSLPDAYPGCTGIGGAQTGWCQQLSLTLEIDDDYPNCADVGRGVECIESIRWQNGRYGVWVDSGNMSLYVDSLPRVNGCAPGALSCDRFFVFSPLDKSKLDGSGWLRISDPEVTIRYPDPDDPSDHLYRWYSPETAIYVPPPVQVDPVASFEYSLVEDEPGLVRFTSTSTDPGGRPLSTWWDFGDGSSSVVDPAAHRYTRSGVYVVTLTVRNADGGVDSATRFVTVVVPDRPLVVNSTGDAPATDASKGCDTGGTVGDVPECTLRAAIETINAGGPGGSTISFGIAGSGVPEIALGAALPAITAADVAIDGSTQAGGLVAVDGPGTGAVLSVSAPRVRVTGLAVDDGETGLLVGEGGSADISQVVIGTDPAGTTAGSLENGVVVMPGSTTGTVVADSTIAAGWGILALGPGVEVRGNHIGVTSSGSAPLANTHGAIGMLGNGGVVADNVIWGRTLGVFVYRGNTDALSGTDAQVTGNRIGLASGSDSALAGMGEGVRVEGATGATIRSNRIATDKPGISIIGVSVTSSVEDGEQLEVPGFFDTSDEVSTVKSATVADNVVATPGSSGAEGIFSWGGASGVSLSGNTVVGARSRGVRIVGGAGQSVAGSTIGAGSVGPVTGIEVEQASDVTVGRIGGENSVFATGSGIVAFDVDGAAIRGNRVGVVGEGGENGIATDSDTTGVTVVANIVTGFEVGISTRSPNASVTDNTVSASSGQAIAVQGQDLTVTGNSVGLVGAASPGNPGDGIVVAEGSTAAVNRNRVVSSGGWGVAVEDDSLVKMRGNRIAGSGGEPIRSAAIAPRAPVIAAAMRLTTAGSDRTLLVVKTNKRPDDVGTLELFANDDCLDGEADRVLEVIRSVAVDQETRIVLLAHNPTDDHFTATFTTDEGGTSALSACTSISPVADADGDGSPDALDQLVGGVADPGIAVIVTDDEELLAVRTDVGRLVGVGVVDAPSGLPAGAVLPYGAISFAVEGLEVGGEAVVDVFTLTGAPTTGTGYLKYGVEGPEEEPHWYRFDGAADGPGAERVAVDVAGYGVRAAYRLTLQDGERGDANGFTDGRIVDPGGPALFDEGPGAVDPPTGPSPVRPEVPVGGGSSARPTTPDASTTTTPATSSPSEVSTPSVPSLPGASDPTGGTNGGAGVGADGGAGAGGGRSGAAQTALARTGSDPSTAAAVGLSVLAFGLLTGLVSRPRRSPAPRSPGTGP